MNDAQDSANVSARAVCEYCGLPVRGKGGTDKQYCCLGCKIADQVTSSDLPSGLGKTALQLGLAIFFSMNVMVFTLALWSWDAYSIAQHSHAETYRDLLRLACLIFATPVVLILGRPLVESILSQAKQHVLTADVLLLAGVVAAFAYSVLSILTGGEHIYFEVACMILVAVTLGRWFEAETKQRARQSLSSLQKILPESASVWRNGGWHATALDQVPRGARLRVLSGERVPLDGVVHSGESFVDEQLVTGESESRHVESGDLVYGGAVNLDGTLELNVEATADEGVVKRLVDAVQAAARTTSRPERLADRMATGLAIVILVVGSGVFVWQWQHHGWQPAMMTSMAVVLIACPCALAVATPLAIWTALSRAAKRGVVFRTSDDLLELARVDHLCLDKTGTITSGEPEMDTVFCIDAPRSIDDSSPIALPSHPVTASAVRSNSATRVGSHAARAVALGRADIAHQRSTVLELTWHLAAHSHHPLARATRAHLSEFRKQPNGPDEAQSAPALRVDSVRTIPGRGLVARCHFPVAPPPSNLHDPAMMAADLDGKSTVDVVVGSERLCRQYDLHFNASMQQAYESSCADGQSTMLVGWEGWVRGLFTFRENIRPSVAKAIKALNAMKVEATILTGDRSQRAAMLADELGMNRKAELLPEEKDATIRDLQKKGQCVAMVGDGLNDAPALAVAHVGIALGCGAELTRDAANVCLLSSDLSLIPWAIQLARSTERTIRRNLFWAVAYNSLGIVFAATGRLNPMLAALAMVLSSVFVITESLRHG